MFADTTGAEVVDHSLECREWRAAVGPDLSAVGFLLSWSQHLYRCFIGVDYALGQHCFAQRIDQRLKLHAGLTHPLRQCRARDTDAIMHQHFHTVGPTVGKRSAQCRFAAPNTATTLANALSVPARHITFPPSGASHWSVVPALPMPKAIRQHWSILAFSRYFMERSQ